VKAMLYPDIEMQGGLNHGSLSGSFLDDLRREKDDPTFTDGVLVCQGEEILCHRVLLGARSDVFRKMFLQKDYIEGTVQITDLDKLNLVIVVCF